MTETELQQIASLLEKHLPKPNGSRFLRTLKQGVTPAIILALLVAILWTPKEIMNGQKELGVQLRTVDRKVDQVDTKLDTSLQRNREEHEIFKTTSVMVSRYKLGIGKAEIDRLTEAVISATEQKRAAEAKALRQATEKAIADKASLDASIKAGVLEAIKAIEEAKVKSQTK